MTALGVFLSVFFAYHAATLLAYFVPVMAAALSRGPRPPNPLRSNDRRPTVAMVGACRRAAAVIPGFVRAARAQAYPPGKLRVVLAIDRDDASDPSVEVARALGAEVYERFRPEIKTKGAALNGLFLDRFRHDDADAAVVFDIDARPDPLFAERVAAHLAAGAEVVQAAAVSRTAGVNGLTGISELGQAVSRSHQRGRAILGLPGLLSGGGMVFSRAALERLGWQTSTRGHLSDDGELNLRCCLAGVRVRYAPDLAVPNDVPADPGEVRSQRRRWSAAYQELIVPYFKPMLRRALGGDWRVIDYVLSLLFASTFSLMFTGTGLLTLALAAASLFIPTARPWAAAGAALTACHALVYHLALRAAGRRLTWREARELPVFLSMRALAFFEGWVLAYRRRGRSVEPAKHAADEAPAPLEASR